jgi:hypothetical protein
MASATDKNVYFREGPALDLLEKIVKRTGLTANAIIVEVLERELPKYALDPTKLLPLKARST